MKRVARLVVVLLWSTSAITAHGAQTLYKSIGPDGRVVYSDRPPAEGRLEKTITFENLPSSPLPASAASYVEQLSRKGPSAAATVPISGVVLYSATWCGFCKKAKSYLAEKGITYQDFDIDTKDGLAAFAHAGGAKGVPLLIAGGQRVQGFSAAAYDALFAIRK